VEKFCEEFEINIVASMLGPFDSLSISNENHLVSSTSRSSESDAMIDEETGKENYDFVNVNKTKRESKDDSTVDVLEESTTESDKVKMYFTMKQQPSKKNIKLLKLR
jgi:hypothetical protein